MNIRPHDLQTTPVAVPDASRREQRISLRTILIWAVVALAIVAFVVWRIFFSGPATPVTAPPPVKAFFTEAQTVHAGYLLFQIDPRPYKAALDSASASLASAKAKAERYARL